MENHSTRLSTADEPACLVISCGMVLSGTPNAALLFGYASHYQMTGLPLASLLPHLHVRTSQSGTVLGRHCDGSGLWLRVETKRIHFLPQGFLLFAEDVTEEKLLEISAMSPSRRDTQNLMNH